MADAADDADAATPTVSIPSLVLLAALLLLAARYLLFPSSSSSSASSATGSAAAGNPSRGGSGGGPPVDAGAVEQVMQMFPQLDRRAVAWDLRRNGGRVAATAERVLARGYLDTPPPSFQPNLPDPAAATAGTTTSPPAGGAATAAPSTDLIAKYNLAAKLQAQRRAAADADADAVAAEPDAGSPSADAAGAPARAWAPSKAERAELLAQRREEMILGARRRMEEKDRRSAEKGKTVLR